MNMQRKLRRMIAKEQARCERLYEKLNKQFSDLPKGSVVLRNGQPYRAVRENGKLYVAMLTTKEADLLQGLKMRRYSSKALPVLKKRITACRQFLKNAPFYDPAEMINSLPRQYHEHCGYDIWLDGDIDPEAWASGDYPHNPMEIQVPHYTAAGLMTRSKSEQTIGTRLEENEFIIRYELELILGKQRAYPDFAILLPISRKIIYWEHLGLIDNPDYVLHNLKKLELYAEHGIRLGENLIITYETKDHPLTIFEVDRKIRQLKAMDR